MTFIGIHLFLFKLTLVSRSQVRICKQYFTLNQGKGQILVRTKNNHNGRHFETKVHYLRLYIQGQTDRRRTTFWHN